MAKQVFQLRMLGLGLGDEAGVANRTASLSVMSSAERTRILVATRDKDVTAAVRDTPQTRPILLYRRLDRALVPSHCVVCRRLGLAMEKSTSINDYAHSCCRHPRPVVRVEIIATRAR